VTELWTQQNVARMAAARAQARALQELTASFLPCTVASSGIHGDWPLSGYAMLARSAGTMQSVMALIPQRRATDAAVLLRTLFESTVTFAWIAIDPAVNAEAWVRWDRRQRLKAHNDLRQDGARALLEPAVRAQFEALIAARPMMPESLAVRAEQADAHWATHVKAIEADPPAPAAFRGMYRYIYRSESQHSHAAVASLEPLIINGPGPGQFQVLPVETDPGEFTPFTRTTMFYALALLVAESALGLAGMEREIDAIFARHGSP
jgi:hypothetical protein